MGDFSQLPPIVQNSSDSILNADIFQYCGITNAVEMGYSHNWLCLLDTQYRMHPFIADFASINMYHALLRSADSMKSKRANIVESFPLKNQALGLADVSGMLSVCTRTSDSSRVNPLSAFVSFGLALQASSEYDVGIITPYNAQSRLLHAMSRDVMEKDPDSKIISCATVHQFQGSEKDAIIFDAVDCYRQRFPGMLLTSTNNNYANRLFNVALTRARGKFIAVTNVGYMENKNLSSGLLFSKLISKYKRSDGCLKGEQLERCFIGSSLPCYQWYTSNEAEAIYLRDLSNGKKEICIDIPGKLELSYDSSKKLSETLNKMRSSGIRIQIRAESKKVLPTCLQPFSIENKYIANPITLIDKRVIWFGEPLSAANFTSEGQTLKMQFRPVIRFEGRHTANALYGFMEMNRTIDQASLARDGEAGDKTLASFISAYTQCKKCGSPMKLLKSRGKYFMGCSNYPNCKSTELITVDLIERYFVSFGKTGKHCPQDHTSLEAKLGPYGVYVQCCGLARHKFKLDEI